MYDTSFKHTLAHLATIQVRPKSECDRLPHYVCVGHIDAMGASMAGLSIDQPPALIEPGDQWHHVLTSAILVVKKHLYECAIVATGDFDEAVEIYTIAHITTRFHVLISEWGNVYCAPKNEQG